MIQVSVTVIETKRYSSRSAACQIFQINDSYLKTGKLMQKLQKLL